jgi:transmembrane sensor
VIVSNVTPFRDRNAVKQLAGQWLARVDRGLSREEHQALGVWLRDRQCRAVLFRLARDWDSMSVISELAESFPLREADHSRWHLAGRAVAVLVVVAALTGTAFYWRSRGIPMPWGQVATQPTVRDPGRGPFFDEVYSTQIGQRRVVDLPDHSRVGLNTNTEIRVELSDHARLLTMSRGEAMFEVAKDPTRVFTVRVAGYEFKAIGTAFAIRVDAPRGLQLTVTEGRVRVHRNAPVNQPANQGSVPPNPAPTAFEETSDVVVDANRAVSISGREARSDALTPDQVAAATAWQHGAIVFEAMPLAQVVNELQRYSSEQFVIAEPDLAQIPVSGYFEVGNIESLTAALQQNVGVKITRQNGVLLLSRARPNP